MEVQESDVAAIPVENLHVPVGEFVAVWRAAEEAAVADWAAFGVAATCRWLACATVRPAARPWHLAPAPVTERTAHRATPELIEKEYLAAEVLAMRDPPPLWLADRAGWLGGVCATFNWAWRRTAPAPFTTFPSVTKGPRPPERGRLR